MAWIEGRNPVREALRAGRPLRRILVAEGTKGIADILGDAERAGVRIDRVPRAAVDARAETRAHQGVAAEAEDFVYRPWKDAVADAGEPALLLALDGVTDPHNLGSLIRSAEAAGAHAVVIPSRRSAQVNATVEKVSSGATEHVVVDRVTNLSRTLSEMRESGIWIVALDATGSDVLFGHALLAEPVVLVVGAEGAGVSRLITERADVRARIPLAGKTASLNAGVAGGIAVFEARRMRLSKH